MVKITTYFLTFPANLSKNHVPSVAHVASFCERKVVKGRWLKGNRVHTPIPDVSLKLAYCTLCNPKFRIQTTNSQLSTINY